MPLMRRRARKQRHPRAQGVWAIDLLRRELEALASRMRFRQPKIPSPS